jgi:hypothetical protein
MGRGHLVSLGAILVVGVLAGRCGSGTTPPPVSPPVRVVEVPGPAQVVKRPYLPERCLRVVRLALDVRRAAGVLDTAAAPQMDLMDRVQRAIAEHGDVTELNRLTTEQRALRSATLDAATELHSELHGYASILRLCEEEVHR